ncbi:protein TOPLESS [Tanacetum coccineum]
MSSDYTASVNRVTWSPDGTLFGVAFSKHIVQIYSYIGGDDLRNHLEIDAHIGSVNDLAFSYPNKQLCIVTCGEDRLIKVWDAVTGTKQFTFEGHEAPVYSVCPHFKENIQMEQDLFFRWSTPTWLFSGGNKLRRIISLCGKWMKAKAAVKRAYNGLGKRSHTVLQFDTTKNRFLAAGDEFVIKIWDMDNISLLTTIDAEGGLSVAPCIRFNKEGILMAVSTKDNGIKILANPDGIRLLRTMENSRSFDPSRVASASAAVVKSQAMSTFGVLIHLPGQSIMDRATLAVHKLWKWPRNDRNSTGKATANVVPQLWQPASGILMTNVISETNPEEAVPCFALSKNDSYVMSASGGKISLFNMMTFKTMTTFMPPPPAATFLAFHPQDNNIIAIGMEDSSIQIYNVRIDEFHNDQTQLLVVHETQLAIYEAPKLERVKQIKSLIIDILLPILQQWVPPETSGLTDGGVIVFERQESDRKWGTSQPTENGVGPSSITVGVTSTTDSDVGQ